MLPTKPEQCQPNQQQHQAKRKRHHQVSQYFFQYKHPTNFIPNIGGASFSRGRESTGNSALNPGMRVYY